MNKNFVQKDQYLKKQTAIHLLFPFEWDYLKVYKAVSCQSYQKRNHKV